MPGWSQASINLWDTRIVWSTPVTRQCVTADRPLPCVCPSPSGRSLLHVIRPRHCRQAPLLPVAVHAKPHWDWCRNQLLCTARSPAAFYRLWEQCCDQKNGNRRWMCVHNAALHPTTFVLTASVWQWSAALQQQLVVLWLWCVTERTSVSRCCSPGY